MGQAALKTEATAVQWKLREWARWRLIQSGAALGFPHHTPERRLLGGSLGEAMITDDEAERVDLAVCRLMERNEEQAQVLVLCYIERLAVYQVAERLRLNYRVALRLKAQAETAIEYLLEMLTIGQ